MGKKEIEQETSMDAADVTAQSDDIDGASACPSHFVPVCSSTAPGSFLRNFGAENEMKRSE